MVGKNAFFNKEMVLKMVLYREIYRLSKNFPGFSEFKKRLDSATGLKNEIEKLSENSVVFSNNQFKTDVEVSVESRENGKIISLFFVPKRKKNYFEWALMHVLNKYLERSNKNIPAYAEKKWKDLSFFEKYLK